MELGEKILKARLEAGLSQRQVCGDTITRNMLSRIEHGVARPSMKTLQYLSGVLGKPVGYFLGEVEESSNECVMAAARGYFQNGKYALVLQTLEDFREPDPVYAWEKGLLGYVSCLLGAENAAKEGREPVKEKFLSQSRRFSSPYILPPLLSYLERLRSGNGAEKTNLDEALLLRAKAAMEGEDPDRARRLLEAVEKRDKSWFFLSGKLALSAKDYTRAEAELLRGEERQCLPLLEECYLAQGNYEKAYFCAYRRRETEKKE